MKVKLLKAYLKQENYKNKVFADYLKDNLNSTKVFISSCSRNDFLMVLRVFKTVALYLCDYEIVDIVEYRAKKLNISCSKSYFNDLYDLLGEDKLQFRFIKALVDEIDPLDEIKKIDKLDCYDDRINELCKSIDESHFNEKIESFFMGAIEEKMQEVKKQIIEYINTESIERFMSFKPQEYYYYYSIDDDNIGVVIVDIVNKKIEYHEWLDEALGGTYGYENYPIEDGISEYYIKLLCNELLNTTYDLSICDVEGYNYSGFETFSTYKNGKCHELTIDAKNKRYIYDVKEIKRYDYILNNNEFIFDAILNGIKKEGFKELVIKED